MVGSVSEITKIGDSGRYNFERNKMENFDEMKQKISQLETRLASAEDLLRILINRSVLSKPGQQKNFEIHPDNPIFVIQKIVAEAYNIDPFLLTVRANGDKNLRVIRKLAMGLCAKHCAGTHKIISIAFGRSRPSTVSHAYRNMETLKKNDPGFRVKYEFCEEKIMGKKLHHHEKEASST
jgi:chromosomal replication initiation ATPase DnaA